jgi:tetratricopeptide (TPR) repeat protein
MNSHAGLAAAIALLIASLPAIARPIHYAAVSSAELDKCDRQYWRGQVEEARRCYQAVLQSDGDAEIRAEAAWGLNDLHTANRLFQTAAALKPDNAGIRTRWGDLYADSHQDAEAMALYREALALDSDDAFAMLGAARTLAGRFDDEANRYLEPLLDNATLAEGARLGAWLLVSRIALENQDVAEATRTLANAESLIERNGWPPLELYALRAAADLIEEKNNSPWTARSLEYNPAYGDIYAIPAHFYVITRRYRQAINLYQKAVDTEPGLAAAHVELGVNLLRDNQFTRARRHLETAHEVDPFSPVAVNTLRLLDSFDNFALIQDPEPGTAGGGIPIVLRLHRDEAPAIRPYAIELTRRSIEEFTRRYEFELREPVVIEMYPDHEDFAVRTAGMPGIGILGATFGYVVAMDSPSARSTDQFQWGTTLWHEMAHVFTLEASDHLVPRWFSEGVSVFEEWRSGPTPGVRIPMSVYSAMHDDRFLPVATLDQGFIRPSYPEQVIVSYMQAGLVCQFIDTHYGSDKLAALLGKFSEGLDTADAIPAVLDVSAAQFDREFGLFVEREHGAVLLVLEDWHAAHAALSVQSGQGDWGGVTGDAEAVIELHPGYVEPDSAYLMLAKAHDELGEPDQAMAALTRFWKRGGYDPAALKRLAALLEESGREVEAIAALNTVVQVQPLDDSLHETLGRLLLEQGDGHGALREFEILLALKPHDKANAYLRVAEAHRAVGNVEQSRNHVLLALDFAPGFRPAQRLLLELSRSGRQ